ncbi:MAG: hypothetical protein IJN90_06915 [Bacilli bacterium]|nr:hypothetical protein [Bacilli bacterium]
MKRKVSILVIVLSIVMIVSGSVMVFLSKDKETPDHLPQAIDFKEKDLEIVLCDDINNCPYASKHIFKTYIYEGNNPKLINMFDDLNAKSNEYYNNNLNSLLDSNSCSKWAGIFKYDLRYISDYYIYFDDDFLNITVGRMKVNLCTDEVNNLPVQTYTYDIKNDKFLSKEDIITKNDLNDGKIIDAIKEYILEIEPNVDKSLLDNIDNDFEYYLYYQEKDKVGVYFFVDFLKSSFSFTL